MDCWAEALEDCSAEPSKEHLITAALFSGGSVTVKGLHWCRSSPRRIGVSAFSRQMLCKRHNNELSEVDNEAVRAFRAFKDFGEVIYKGQGAARPMRTRVKTYSING